MPEHINTDVDAALAPSKVDTSGLTAAVSQAAADAYEREYRAAQVAFERAFRESMRGPMIPRIRLAPR